MSNTSSLNRFKNVQASLLLEKKNTSKEYRFLIYFLC